jgi:hypothetical protein
MEKRQGSKLESGSQVLKERTDEARRRGKQAPKNKKVGSRRVREESASNSSRAHVERIAHATENSACNREYACNRE